MQKQPTRTRRSPLFVLLVLLILILISLFFYFRSGPPAGPEVITCDEATTEAPLQTVATAEPPIGANYVSQQIVVSGTQADIADVLGDIDAFDGLRCQQSLGAGADGAPAAFAGLQTDLYQLPAGVSEWEAIRLIYEENLRRAQEAAASDERPPLVFADPNYLVGFPVEGDPASNGHSGVGGGTAGQPGQAPDEIFANQWAFWSEQPDTGLGGINLLSAFDEKTIDDTITGADVDVAIFDTSPYTVSGTYPITWINPSFDLDVDTPVAVVAVGDVGSEVLDIKNHGLFAAGLVHHLAPESDIRLIRVLNDTGQGDLFSLIGALRGYVDGRLSGPDGNLNNTVINLSLGVNLGAAEPAPEVGAVLDLITQLLPLLSERDQRLLAGARPVPALKLPLVMAREGGAVIVAASGNDSTDTDVRDAQLPAGFSEVIGVASSNVERRRSCFSNAGQIAAPGGSGMVRAAPVLDGEAPGQTQQQPPDLTAADSIGDVQQGMILGGYADAEVCAAKSMSKLCARAVEDGFTYCPYAVVSLVDPDTYPTGYAYWVGTSFSTPLVSGLAALVLDASGGARPEAVEAALNCGSGGSVAALPPPVVAQPLGVGIIDVPATLTQRCLP